MTVAAIDIGTNSMRILVLGTDGAELHRQVCVTALGKGVDATGRFDPVRVSATLDVMAEFAAVTRRLDVGRFAAVATSASRDAENGPDFVSAVSDILGVVPEIITGEREAALSYAGATAGRDAGSHMVIDIGGGSTEFIVGRQLPSEMISIDMGSTRLADRCLSSRPATPKQLAAAAAAADDSFATVPRTVDSEVIGVAGTFTSLAAIVIGLEAYDRQVVDGTLLTTADIESAIDSLAQLSIADTAAIPSLDPNRAPVILAGAVVAARALNAVGTNAVVVSESDLLDALAAELLDA